MQNSFKIDHFLQKIIGKMPGSLSAKNKSETGSSSSRVTLVVKLLRFLTVVGTIKNSRIRISSKYH